MIKAGSTDKELVIEILARSFNHNKSVNYIIKQDKKREQRLRSLMNYSVETCFAFGNVFLSDDKKACALVLYPDQKKATFRSLIRDLRLIWESIGLRNIRKTLLREAKLKSLHPREPLCHLWYIGVEPDVQQMGIGTGLLLEVIAHSKTLGRPLYLETSTERNLPWYKKHGFRIYHEIDLGYKIFFLKKE